MNLRYHDPEDLVIFFKRAMSVISVLLQETTHNEGGFPWYDGNHQDNTIKKKIFRASIP